MILTLDDVAAELLGVHCEGDLSADEARMAQSVLDDVNRAIGVFLSQSIEFAERTEILTAGETDEANSALPYDMVRDRRDVLTLKSRPVQVSTVIVKVAEQNQDFEEATGLIYGTDYQLDDVVGGYSTTGVLRRLDHDSWPLAPGGVMVTYSGGIRDEDTDAMAAIRLAESIAFQAEYARRKTFKRFIDAKGAGPMSSETIGSYSRSHDTSAFRDISGTGQSSVLPPAAIDALSSLVSYSHFI